jgi:hypothetical protein
LVSCSSFCCSNEADKKTGNGSVCLIDWFWTNWLWWGWYCVCECDYHLKAMLIG